MQELDWANLGRYKEHNEKLALPLSDEKRIVFFGDSITEQWKEIVPNYFSKNKYINRGIGGQTTSQMLLRFRSDVIKLKPSIVHILAGTNDIAENTGPITLEGIMGNIISMVELAEVNKIEVILASVLPAFNYPWIESIKPAETIIELNKMIKEYSDKKNISYIDYHSQMVDENKGMRKQYTTDGVHVSIKGYNEVMIPLAENTLKILLER